MKRGKRNLIIAVVIIILLILGALFLSKNITGNSILNVRNPFASVQDSINAAKENIKKQFTEAEKEAAIEAIKQELTPYIDQKMQEAKNYADERIATHERLNVQANNANQQPVAVNRLLCSVVSAPESPKTGDNICSELNKICVAGVVIGTNQEYRDVNCAGTMYSDVHTTYVKSCSEQQLANKINCMDRGNVGGRRLVMRYVNEDVAICCNIR